MDSFITMCCRDETAVPPPTPNQGVYLRENIRSRLLVAARAVSRHQEETWKRSLDSVSAWVCAYYNTDDVTTKAFLDEVDKLSQQSITVTVSKALQSQASLEKLIQTRVRNLMARPAVTAGDIPPPAPAAPTTPAVSQGG